MAGKLWNPTYIIKAGRYLVWHILRLTDLHYAAKAKKRTKRIVRLGWEFHNEISFWKGAIEQNLVSAGESLGALFYARVERPPSRRYDSDASWGVCPKVKIYWRYDLHPVCCRGFRRTKR